MAWQQTAYRLASFCEGLARETAIKRGETKAGMLRNFVSWCLSV